MAQKGRIFRIVEGKGPSEADIGIAFMSFAMEKESLKSERKVRFEVTSTENDEIMRGAMVTVEITGFGESGVIKGFIKGIDASMGVTNIIQIRQYSPCEIKYNPRQRSGKIVVFSKDDELSPTSDALNLITLSSCLSACDNAIHISGCAPYNRVIVMSEDGSLHEVYRGSKFSQEDFEKKRGYKNFHETDARRIELADKMGCGKIAREIFGN